MAITLGFMVVVELKQSTISMGRWTFSLIVRVLENVGDVGI